MVTTLDRRITRISLRHPPSRTLYLLPNGIFFGFKKPVLYITHDSINFVNITSKTSKTFNLIVQVGDEDKDGKAYEFCMIEINDFDGVISYVDKSKSKWASASPSTADTHIKREKSCSEDDDDTMDTSAVALPIPPSISSFANFKFEEDEDEDEDFHGGAGAGSDGDDDELLEYTEGEEEIGSEDTDEDSVR